jgi:YggT family protein
MVYIANLVRLLFSIYIILIFLRVLFAWLRPNMFNPLVRFVYSLTDPYLRLFAGMRFLRIGAFDLTPILAFYLLYLLQELSYKVLLTGFFSVSLLVSIVIILFFRFVYFVLFIFIVAAALRFIFELIRWRAGNVVVAIVYSMSEPVVLPFRRLLRTGAGPGNGRVVDPAVLLALAALILARYLALPRLLLLISAALG